MRTAFPRIEKLCQERGVFFAPLDLRWGVTSEQSGSGQVIKICLEEIDRSRPYFVGSLGKINPNYNLKKKLKKIKKIKKIKISNTKIKYKN